MDKKPGKCPQSGSCTIYDLMSWRNKYLSKTIEKNDHVFIQIIQINYKQIRYKKILIHMSSTSKLLGGRKLYWYQNME